MSAHDTIRTAIGSLVANRYYPNRFPQEAGAPTWPAIRGTIIVGTNAPDACGGGDIDEDDLLIQIDFVAESYDAADALLASAAPLLEALTPAFVRQPGRRDAWDPDTRTHAVSVDFLLQQSSAA